MTPEMLDEIEARVAALTPGHDAVLRWVDRTLSAAEDDLLDYASKDLLALASEVRRLRALAAKWRAEAAGGSHLYDSENFRGGALRSCADEIDGGVS